MYRSYRVRLENVVPYSEAGILGIVNSKKEFLVKSGAILVIIEGNKASIYLIYKPEENVSLQKTKEIRSEAGKVVSVPVFRDKDGSQSGDGILWTSPLR